jgi:cytochrome b561
MNESVYSPVNRALHWLTLGLLTAQFLTAWSVDLVSHAQEPLLIEPHRAIGMLLWLIVISRLVCRWVVGTPPAESTTPRWQVWSAHLTHIALYALLLIVPVLGYLYSEARALPDLFGVLHLPSIIAANKQLARQLRDLHGLGANLMLYLIGLHSAAALYHHYWMRDNVLHRMLPMIRPRSAATSELR